MTTTEGGFWIREIGLYDDEGVLIAVANCPETYKPQLQEGSGRTQTIRMILVVTNTEAITLKIDPSVVLATRKYVDDEVLELRLYVDDQMRNHIAAQDPHTQYAQKHNPTFTGEPKAPTPAAGNNTTRIATTEFVQAAITALINGAPATLDTLKEIAAAINNDPKFSTTINNALSGKQPLDETLTHLSGKDVAGLLAYLGLGEGSALPVGVPVPWPSATPPTGWVKCNGAAFSAEEYPELAKAYPTNILPDLRGEFIRGWDDGRGVDSSRTLLSWQKGSYLVQEANISPDSVVQFSANDIALLGWDKTETNSDILRAKSIPTEYLWNPLPTGAWGIQYLGYARPRNIAFNYIVRAA
ncbi:phage tail protein [Escherichia coli]|nr:phage tail protein [Escherichia coli]